MASHGDNLEPNNGLSGAKIALLVDFDNVVLGLEDPGFDIELVVNALRERGTIVLGRVYGDWYRHNRHRRRLMEQGLELVETPAFGPVIKNSADIRIALDGFEIGLTQSHIDTFAIVSGDSDFLPLIKKLQSLGRRVLVICGNRFTSDMLRRNCNEFISYENLLAQSVGATEDATTLEGAFSLLHRAMAALRERGTEIRGSGVKQMMIQLNPVFSERTFGCTQFRQFLQKAVQNGVVKLGPRDKTSGEFHVLLPDEDETPIQQKVERRAENRARRDDKLLQIAARIEAVPVPEAVIEEDDDFGVEVEFDAPISAVEVGESDYDVEAREDGDFGGGFVFADDAFGYDPETMAEAQTHSLQEIAQNTIARTELLSRGLRPTRRRFSGRSGRPVLEINEDEFIPMDMDGEDDSPEVEVVFASEVTPDDEADSESEIAPEVTAEAEQEAPATENRRLRSRRRRRSASGQITVVSDETPSLEAQTDEADTATAPVDEAERINIGTASESDSEAPIGAVLPVEAPIEAIAEIQTALNELEAGGAEILDESKGVEVEAVAPALPAASAALETADPVGVPAVQAKAAEAEAVKPKRRRPSRSKVKVAPATEAEAAPVAAEVSAPEALVEAEVVAPPQSAPAEAEPVLQAEIEAPATEAAPETEAAPAKPRRRRPSRAKKPDAAPAESSE